MKKPSSLFLHLLILTTMTGKLECNIRNTGKTTPLSFATVVIFWSDLDCDELEITIDIRVNSVEVTWTLIDCAFIYIVTHFVNGVQRSSIYVPHPIYFTDVARVTCSRNRIVIEINQPTGIDEPTPPTKNFVVGLEGKYLLDVYIHITSIRYINNMGSWLYCPSSFVFYIILSYNILQFI